MNDKNPLYSMLGKGDLKWEPIEQVLPPRLPLVDQCLDVARLMEKTNPPNEIARVLSIAGDCLRMYSKPVFVVKEGKE